MGEQVPSYIGCREATLEGRGYRAALVTRYKAIAR
jgi:hypothetical protein